MAMISSADDVNTLAAQVPDTGGVYFVTAFSGLLAPYWDPGAAGLLIGTMLSDVRFRVLTSYLRYIAIYQPLPPCPCHT
jgi:glycerol kinase